ncbi:hypothetical protein D3C87_687530 [compost metagenome]
MSKSRLAYAEERRPGLTKIYEELQAKFPQRQSHDLLYMAKNAWHGLNPVHAMTPEELGRAQAAGIISKNAVQRVEALRND